MPPHPPLLGRTRPPRDGGRAGPRDRATSDRPPRQPREAPPGPGLSAALLAYVFALTLIVTLAPFQLGPPRRVNLLVVGGLSEAAANVMLFVPLGFLWRLARPRGGDPHALRVLGIGMLASAGIEAVQFFLPGRYPALLDVVTNGLGAWLGARVHDVVRQRLQPDARLVSGLALELPLMVLLYLLVPLMWLNGLAVVEAPLATLRILMLGLFGASILAAVQRRYLGPAGALDRRGAALAAALGYLAGAFPALLVRPLAVLPHAAIVAGLCAYLATGRPGRVRPERRFERESLRRAAPFFAAYLALLPLVTPVVVTPAVPVSRVLLLELVQAAAASTLLGYMVAESRGRRTAGYRDSVAWVIAWSALAAGATGLLATAVGTGTLGVSRVAASVTAGVVGGWLYHLQRDRVQALVREGATDAPLATDAPAGA